MVDFLSKNRTVVVLSVIAVILASLTAILAPALKRKTQEAEQLRFQVADLTVKNLSLSEANRTFGQQKTKVITRTVTQAPVTVVRVDNSGTTPVTIETIEYRDRIVEVTNEDEVTLAVETVLATMRENIEQSVASAGVTATKTETITRRGLVSVGLGYGSGGELWGMASGRVYGPISVWGASNMDFKDAIVGGMVTFW